MSECVGERGRDFVCPPFNLIALPPNAMSKQKMQVSASLAGRAPAKMGAGARVEAGGDCGEVEGREKNSARSNVPSVGHRTEA